MAKHSKDLSCVPLSYNMKSNAINSANSSTIYHVLEIATENKRYVYTYAYVDMVLAIA